MNVMEGYSVADTISLNSGSEETQTEINLNLPKTFHKLDPDRETISDSIRIRNTGRKLSFT